MKAGADAEARCEIHVDPANWQHLVRASENQMPETAVTITILDQPLAVAAEWAGMEQTADGWRVAIGGLSKPLAEPFRTPCCSGLRGYVSARFFGTAGRTSRGSGESPLIVLSTGSRSAVVSADWLPDDSRTLETILASLRLAPLD